MLEPDFQQQSEKILGALAGPLDGLDEAGALEMDYQDGVITLTLDSGRQFIINKHAPSRQIWLSSPLSGGTHFSYDAALGRWKLPDGRGLKELLAEELKTLLNIEVEFP
jgi:iron donor protein CyaY